MRGINTGNISSARMATVTAVTFIVAFAPVLCGLADVQQAPNTGDCTSKPHGPQVVDVKAPKTTVTLKCNDVDEAKVKPKFNKSNFMVCTQERCGAEQPLAEYIPGATAQKVDKGTAEILIKDLPPAAKTFYVWCGDVGDSTCYIQVNVAQDPSKPGVGGDGHSGAAGGATGSTGGVASGSPLPCATLGGAITIKIPEKGSTAQFTCGGLTLYPLATDRVFAEDCKKEESLKGIVRSDKAEVYTLTADGKPPKKKWCYLCAKSSVTSKNPGSESDYCVVHVESSSRTQSSSAIALAAMLPSVLAMLCIT